jgi:hypothetical protein
MVFALSPKNIIPSGGYLIVTFPIYGSWSEDFALQPFGLTPSMSCVNQTSVKNY